MKKKTYSPEFKREAVRLLMTEDRPVTELARSQNPEMDRPMPGTRCSCR